MLTTHYTIISQIEFYLVAYFMCMSVCLNAYMYIKWVQKPVESQRGLNLLELELQIVAGNQTWVLFCKSGQYHYTTSPEPTYLFLETESHYKGQPCWVVVVHAFNPSTQEAETDGSL